MLLLLLARLLELVSYLILAVTGIVALGLVIRMILQWAQVNPFGWFAMNLRKWTEPVLRPLRMGFDNRFVRFDMLPLVAAVLLLMFAFFAASIINSLTFVLVDMAQPRPVSFVRIVLWLLSLAVTSYLGILFLRFLLPYFGMGYSSRSSRFLFQVTEPLLKPFRRVLPMGPVDFSPMLLILVLALAEQLVQRLMLSQ
jgi:YggT family protein